jgi:hypothetical protein
MAVLIGMHVAQSVVADSIPWRVQNALALPSWLSLSGSYRTRYETLDSQFRAGRDGGDQILLLRTTLKAAVRHGPFTVAGEMLDARAAHDDNGTPINAGLVNTAELLQAYLQWDLSDFLAPGGMSELQIGRITMDIGSRRFVARNRFRNTINAFTGINWKWQGASGRKLRAFFTLPVNRRPNFPAALRDNDIKFDDEDIDVKFWGLYYSQLLSWGDHGELFYFGLDEDDSSDRFTRNREFSTVGFRLYRKPQTLRFDYQLEVALQFGESRASPLLSDVSDLDHFAHFDHAELGYSFNYPWHPRLIAQYDFASGDDNPTDGDNERFDTLFGARRFDFGPTSIYGAFARANINTPGLRLVLKPRRTLTGFIAYRAYWLASDRDAWTMNRVRDASGATDSFIGQQVEMRLRFEVVPKNIRFEAGVAHLFAGEFMRDAPNTNGQGDVTHVYSQIGFQF